MKTDETDLDCDRVIRQIFEYLDGEVDPAERGGIERHLERCRSCFSRAEFERRLRSHVARIGSAPVPETLVTRVRALLGGFEAG